MERHETLSAMLSSPSLLKRVVHLGVLTILVGLLWSAASAARAQESEQDEAAAKPAESQIDFEKQVQPILSARCYQCHSADKHEGGLRLDHRDDALAGGDRGVVIVPGDSDGSLLIRFVAGLEEDVVMPPEGDRLSEEEIALLRDWIDSGATWPEMAEPAPRSTHWAYQAPVRPQPPVVANPNWPRNDIDRFVLARLEKEGLVPSVEADRARLIRRVSLDLIGLPPTIEEVDAFLADTSPDAYEKVVDRLLASPQYGECWARMWLDLARYADTQGYEKDNRRVIWRYRDWVIDALNRDLTFDQFTIHQVAGDMLPEASTEQQIATAFHRNTMTNTEGGTDNEEFRVAAVVDRVNTTMSVWMATTLGCAQCHSHKYDPITQRDYYRFLALLNNTADADSDDDAPVIQSPRPEMAAEIKRLQGEIATVQRVLDTQTPELDASLATWDAEAHASIGNWQVLSPLEATSQGGAKLEVLEDQSLLASGDNPANDTHVIKLKTDVVGITGIRLEVLPHASLPAEAAGRGEKGAFVVTQIEVVAQSANDQAANDEAARQSVAFTSAAADATEKGFDVSTLIGAKQKPGWVVPKPAEGKPLAHSAGLASEKPFGFEGGTLLEVTIRHASDKKEANLGHFRLAISTGPKPLSDWVIPENIRQIVATPATERSDDARAQLAAYYRTIAPELAGARKQLEKLTSALPKPPTTPVMQELASPRETHIHVRGSFLNPGDLVTPGVPEVFPQLPSDAPSNRLALARWLVSQENPLTARVIMNRVWAQYFGTGIVETLEDFGTKGSPPSHPELLDYLATEFMAKGWSLKAMHRLIVTSATYRQSSRVTPELLERDPANRLFARGPRKRLTGEAIRDQALAISGLLSGKMYGPSVMPPQPPGIWKMPYSIDTWVTSKGEDRFRRGIYTFWRRTAPYPSFMTFDAPSREFCMLRRPVTNTPLQALATLNDPVYVETAWGLATQMMAATADSNTARAELGFRRCVARRPSEAELSQLLTLYDAALARFTAEPKSADELVTINGRTAPEETDPVQLAAWIVVANVLLNLDEVITNG